MFHLDKKHDRIGMKAVLYLVKESPDQYNSYKTSDRGWRYLLSNKEAFLQFAQGFINAPWVKELNNANINLIDKSFVSHSMKERESDLLYHIQLEDKNILFYLLLELQSTKDQQIPYRLLQYMVNAWDYFIRQEKNQSSNFNLPAIIPCVFYNGKSPWNIPTNFRHLMPNSELFAPYIVDFEYLLVDINHYNDQQLLEMTNLIGATCYIDKTEDIHALYHRLHSLLQTLKRLPERETMLFVAWLKHIAASRTDGQQYDKINRILSEFKEVDTMMSNLGRVLSEGYAEARREGHMEGKQEGRQEGYEEGALKIKLEIASKLLAKGQSFATIRDICNLDHEELELLKAKKVN